MVNVLTFGRGSRVGGACHRNISWARGSTDTGRTAVDRHIVCSLRRQEVHGRVDSGGWHLHFPPLALGARMGGRYPLRTRRPNRLGGILRVRRRFSRSNTLDWLCMSAILSRGRRAGQRRAYKYGTSRQSGQDSTGAVPWGRGCGSRQ